MPECDVVQAVERRMSTSGQDEWLHSMCRMCLHGCGILVHVVDGVAVKIDPDPDNVDNLGKLCPKGNAGLARHYDPLRITAPLQRTNPERGIGVDPKWKPVSWEYAFGATVETFGRIRRSDPRKLLCSFGDFQRYWTWAWPAAVFGSYSFFSTLGTYCGGGYHPVNGAVHGTFATIPDYSHCNYLVQIGSGDGFESHLHLSGTAKRAADARMRGMRVVALDPRLSTTAAKAEEWIPLRPGTDGFFALAMMYVMLYELNQYDREFLRKQTNAPYLIGPDGLYTLDAAGKALVWDSVEDRAKAFDDPSIREYALEGVYIISRQEVRPAFQLFKEKLREYTPERAAELTGVGADTVRRITREFVEAAQIGRSITLDGVEYPYRPAAIQYYRGSHAHRHSFLDNFTYKMANMLVGNIDMPGGHLGVPLGWDPAWGARNRIEPGEQGVLKPWLYELRPQLPFKFPPDRPQLTEYFPVGLEPGELNANVVCEPAKYGLDFRPEALFVFYSNPLWNMPGTGRVAQAMKTLDFIVSIDIQAVSETTAWSDLVLPDTTYLESYSLFTCEAPFVTGHTLRQPVVQPPPTVMEGTNILTELSERLGILDKWNEVLNGFLGLWRNPKYLLEKNHKYPIEEIIDRWAKSIYGEDRGLDWFRKHGNTMRLKTPQELYRPYGNLRLPFYMDFILRTGRELRQNLDRIGLDWMKRLDTSEYQPLPEWRPSNIHASDPEFDLIAITYKSALFTFEDLANIPWLTEIARRRPDLSGVLMNPVTARAKGLHEADHIRITSRYGSVDGVVTLTEGIHPEAIGVSQVGRWIAHPSAVQAPVFNILLSPEIEDVDPVSGGFETAVRVKVEKLRNGGPP